MAEMLAEAPVDKGERLKREGIVIRTFDLWKTYVMGDQVINAVSGVDIEIHRGEYVAIMGPSGSGKSERLNLIGQIHADESDRVSRLADEGRILHQRPPRKFDERR